MAVSWAGCGIIGLNLPISVIGVVWTPGAYVRGFAPAVLVVMSALWLWALSRCLRGLSSRGSMQLTVAVAVLVLLLHPLVLSSRLEGYPPLLHVVGAGICISAAVDLRLASLVIIPGSSAYVAWLRAPQLGTGRAVAEALLVAVSGWLATGALAIVTRANATVRDAVVAAAQAAEDALRASRRTYERQRWNGLIHDKVLSALRTAARGPAAQVPAEAVDLARDALTALNGTGPEQRTSSLRAGWQEHARRVGLTLDAVVTGDVDKPEVRAALREATEEALTNVSRHSGQRHARVRAVLSAADATVLIQDAGIGFAPSARHTGMGIKSSIKARMKVVGGRADVDSAPGRGTRVTLHWNASSEGPPSEWQLKLFAPLMGVGALALVLNVALGAGQWRRIEPLGLPVVAIFLLGALTAAATFVDPTVRHGIPLVAVAAATAGLLAVSTARDAGLDWRYWYLGALTPAAGAIAFRFPAWAGVTFAAAVTATTIFGDVVSGRGFWGCLTGPVPVLFVTAIAGHLLRASFDDAFARAAAASADDTEARLVTAIADERVREDDRRIISLRDSVGQALEHIAAANPMTQELREQFALLESAGRDQLAAPDLVDPALEHRLSLARRRGVRVDIVDMSSAVAVAGRDHVPSCRDVLTALADQVPPATRIRVNWQPDAGGAAATISATLADLQERLPELLDTVRRTAGPHARVTDDADGLLVEYPG